MTQRLAQHIDHAAVDREFPSGSGYRSLSLEATAGIARELDVAGGDVERQALAMNIWPERYARNAGSYTAEEQARLLASSVAVIGLGGLGGLVCELLARNGVGRLLLVDGDRFEESNLNRQLLATVPLIGTSKSAAAAARLREINPWLSIQAIPDFFDDANAQRVLQPCDLAVDCLDNIATRRELAAAARSRGIPLVTAAVAGACGQLAVLYPQDSDSQLLWPADTPSRGIETSIGCLPHAVAVMASLECAEATGILLGRRSRLRRHLLVLDLDAMLWEIVALG